jgi:hypothetical protein
MPIPSEEEIAELIRVHNSPAATAERQARSEAFDPARKWVRGSRLSLSDRVWRAGQSVRAEIDAILRAAIATGEDALLTARKLEEYLAPSPRVHKRMRYPGRGGSGIWNVRRLAVTEIARSQAAASEFAAARSPFIRGLKWSLSPRAHREADACDANATADRYGLGAGVYPPGKEPRMPQHPVCRCHWQPVTVGDDAIIDELRSLYGLGKP